MTPDQITYALGGASGEILLMVVLYKLPHWIIRKIRRKPKMPVRDWLTSWWAGPELLVLGTIFDLKNTYGPPGEPFNLFVSVAVEYVGLAIFIIKIVASIISRFRRRAPAPCPVWPAVSPAVSPAAQPLGRQPPLG